MIKVVTVDTMRQIEAAADANGLSYATMMDHAGQAITQRVLEIIQGRDEVHITLLIGPGNNGGDGLVAGRLIAEQSPALVRFYLLRKRDENDPHLKAVVDAGLFIANADDDQRYRVLRNMIATSDVVLDALFGIGIHLPLRPEVVKVLQAVKQALDVSHTDSPVFIDPTSPTSRTLPPYILAVDCPSGVDCDSGEMDEHTLPADETMTFIAAKPGLFQFPGAGAVGALRIAPIDIPADTEPLAAETRFLVDGEFVRGKLPDRSANAHKGSTGKAFIMAGSPNYFGAPALSAHAAYRVGAGLVAVAAPESVIRTIAANLAEPVWVPISATPAPDESGNLLAQARTAKAVLVGPGWGQAQETEDLLNTLLEHFKGEELPPLVVDADGLNLLAKQSNWWEKLPAHTILTPHPGEMARLAQTDTATVQQDRWSIVTQKAAEWQAIVVLKGAHTLIAEPGGQVAVLPFKTDALAKAGTGDVLAGMVVGFLAQGLALFDAAVVAGYVHGLAGTLAAEACHSSRSVMAHDVIAAIGAAFQRIETA